MNSTECRPVFLTGFPKSGTTLLLSLLDGHPDLCVFPKETKFFELVRREIEEDREQAVGRFYERTFLGRQFGMQDPIEIRLDKERYLQALDRRWRDSKFRSSAFLGAAVLAYGDVTGQTGRKWWVEKTPQTERHAHSLAGWYQGMRMIHVVRDPRANFASMKTWRQKNGLSISVPVFAHGWAKSVKHSKRNKRYCPVLTLCYEDLVNDTTASMELVCDFLQVPFHDSMLVPTLGQTPFQGNSIYGQNFSNVSKDSLYRWREVLEDWEVKQLQDLLSSEMEDYSYGPDAVAPGPANRNMSIFRVRALKRFYDIYTRFPTPVLKAGNALQSVIFRVARWEGRHDGSPKHSVNQQ